MKELYKVIYIFLYKYLGFDLMYMFIYFVVILSSCSFGVERRRFSVLLSCLLDFIGLGKLGSKLV